MLRIIKKAKNMGVFELPIKKIVALFKHRKKLGEVEKAFFYNRYCNALILAHKIGLFQALCQDSCSLKDLSQKTNTPEESIKTLSSILISQGFVNEKNGLYWLSEFGDLFFKEEEILSSYYLLDLMAEQALGLSSTLSSIYNGDIPAHVDVTNPHVSYHVFLTAVNHYLLWCGRELLQKVDFGDVRSAIVGSMGVSFSSLLLKKYPQMKVTYGCLEHLVKNIPRLCEVYDVSLERVTGMHVHSGDPMKDDWGSENYDLIFLTRKMLIDPKQRIGEKFAEKSFQVLSPGGKAVFWEIVYPEQGKMPINRAMEAMFDFCTSPSAIARTEKDYRDLLEGIGFKHVTIHDCLEGQTTFIIAEK